MNRDQQGSIPYQVDYHNEASGKRLAATKRRIVWRFGFANDKAIADGQTGNNCRGVEHEVSVVWSLTSGKRQVAFDGREIHFSKTNESKLDMSWTMQGGHNVKVVAHATPPLRAIPGFRQFDFLLDGMSYFDMAKIYELGTPAMARRRGGGGGARSSAVAGSRGSSSSNHNNYSSSSHRHNEDYDDDQRSFASAPLPTVTPEKSLAAAGAARPAPATAPPTRAASMPAAVVAVATVDLLALPMPASSGNDLLSTPTVSQHQPQQHNNYQSQPAPVTAQPQQYNGYHQPQLQHQQQGQQPAYYQQQQGQQQQQQPQYAQSRVDEFAPLPPPPRTFQDVSNQILSNYGPDPNAPLALANAPHYDDHAYSNSMSSALIADAPHHNVTPEKHQLTLRPTMEPISIAELEAREHEQQYSMSELERAVKSIVNLDDITETVETPEQAKHHRLKEANKPIGRSKPKPAVAPAWNLGLKPALKDIKEHAAPQKSEPTREIMRAHHTFDPAAAQAGMMVMYGATATPPPPGIPAVQGFGAGVHASHNQNFAYHPQQQQQQRRQQQQPQQAMYAAAS